ncbi:MAG: hypothetical protein MHPSP_002311 [Paramarteilia canceri]
MSSVRQRFNSLVSNDVTIELDAATAQDVQLGRANERLGLVQQVSEASLLNLARQKDQLHNVLGRLSSIMSYSGSVEFLMRQIEWLEKVDSCTFMIIVIVMCSFVALIMYKSKR